jgi:hypothetical protein
MAGMGECLWHDPRNLSPEEPGHIWHGGNCAAPKERVFATVTWQRRCCTRTTFIEAITCNAPLNSRRPASSH